MTESSVWYAIPSARPDGGTLKLWHQRGYKLAVQRDSGASTLPLAEDTLQFFRDYKGYAESVNHLCSQILKYHPKTKVIVTGGDDVLPDPNHSPETIQQLFTMHFPDLYGILQPTADHWMVDGSGRSASERVAYSPWMGRTWCLEANQGHGPLWPEYFHHFVDEDLQESAFKQGMFAQDKRITQYHHHWQRKGGSRPPHLRTIDRPENWKAAKALFESRKEAGFPGSERKR